MKFRMISLANGAQNGYITKRSNSLPLMWMARRQACILSHHQGCMIPKLFLQVPLINNEPCQENLLNISIVKCKQGSPPKLDDEDSMVHPRNNGKKCRSERLSQTFHTSADIFLISIKQQEKLNKVQ